MMKVLFQARKDLFALPRSDTFIYRNLKESLKQHDVHVYFSSDLVSLDEYNLIHLVDVDHPLTRVFALHASRYQKPFVLTPLLGRHGSFIRKAGKTHALTEAYLKTRDRNVFYKAVKELFSAREEFPWGDNRDILESAAAVMATGDSEAKRIEPLLSDRSKLQTIRLAPPVLPKDVSPELFCQRYGVRDFILCVGSVDVLRKNHLLLLYALQDEETPLVFIGGRSFVPETDVLCRRFLRQGKTIFTGWVEPQMLASAYKAARLFVIPSFMELPGLATLQAAEHNVPIVFTNEGTSPEYVTYGTKLCDPHDANSIRDAVLTTLQEQHASSLVEGLNWKRFCEETAEVYSRVAQMKKNPYLTLRRNNIGQALSVQCSIIIPVFNKLNFTKACLDSIKKHTQGVPYEIIVVDNGSTDGTFEYLQDQSDIKVLHNTTNQGFARACNMGADAAQGKHLVFLNNDTVVRSDWLSTLVEAAESSEEVWAVGSKLLYPDGTVQHAGVAVSAGKVPYHIYQRLPADMPCVNKKREFPIVTAACMLVKREPFFALRFNESYLNGGEDIELCLALRKLGGKILYCPESVVEHHEFGTPGRESFAEINQRLMLNFWSGELRPDDREYFAADGMEARADNNGEIRVLPAQRRNGQSAGHGLTSILIVSHNCLDHLPITLDEISRCTPEPHEVIVVDDCSTDGTLEYLAHTPRARIVTQQSRVGFVRSCVDGLEVAKGDFILILRPNVTVFPAWLSRLLLHIRPGVGAVGPLSDGKWPPQYYKKYADDLPQMQLTPEALDSLLSQFHEKRGVETPALRDFCLLIDRSAIAEVGFFDTDFCEAYHDLEYSHRLRHAGKKLVVATDVFVHQRPWDHGTASAADPETVSKDITTLKTKVSAYESLSPEMASLS